VVAARLAAPGRTAEAAFPTQLGWTLRLRSGQAQEAAVPTGSFSMLVGMVA